jgi:hypothetical protein
MSGTTTLAPLGSLGQNVVVTADNLPWSYGWNLGATADKPLPWPGYIGPHRRAAIGTSGAASGDTSMGSGAAISTTSGVNTAICAGVSKAIGTGMSTAIVTEGGLGMQCSAGSSACEWALGHGGCDFSNTSFVLPKARDFLQSDAKVQNSPRALFLKNNFLVIKLPGAGLQDSEGFNGSASRGGACHLPTFQA